MYYKELNMKKKTKNRYNSNDWAFGDVYNWVAHSLEQKKFEQKIVPDKKKTYNRKKEKQVSYYD